MFFFGRKKEKAKPNVLSISGEQLCGLIKKAISLAIENVESKSYIIGPEIMFEYDGNIHFVGIKYDKKRAKAEKRTIFSYDLMNLYIDKVVYASLEDLRNNALVDGKKLTSIPNGIIVVPEYGELL